MELDAREKAPRGRPDEVHIFCPGDGCDARLGIRYINPNGTQNLSLEPGYTEVAPRTWRRLNTDRYRGVPRGRTVRRQGRWRLKLKAEGRPVGLSEDEIRKITEDATLGRSPQRTQLAPGSHKVFCYRCGAPVRVCCPPVCCPPAGGLDKSAQRLHPED